MIQIPYQHCIQIHPSVPGFDCSQGPGVPWKEETKSSLRWQDGLWRWRGTRLRAGNFPEGLGMGLRDAGAEAAPETWHRAESRVLGKVGVVPSMCTMGDFVRPTFGWLRSDIDIKEFPLLLSLFPTLDQHHSSILQFVCPQPPLL